MTIMQGGLPAQVASAIIDKTKNESAIMKLARPVAVSGRGETVPVILGDAQAAWVAEGAAKPVSDAQVTHKLLMPQKIAVIDTYSKELVNNEPALFQALMDRLPGALAVMFDKTVSGDANAPDSNFTQLSTTSTAVDVSSNAYDGLVSAMTTIATNGGVMNGFALGAQGQGVLLAAKDGMGRPLFTAGTEAGSLQPILGGRAEVAKGIYHADASGNTIGFAGDWSQAAYGIVGGVDIAISEEASLTLPNGDTVNLWQNNLVAVRAEMYVGFVADVDAFVKLTD